MDEAEKIFYSIFKTPICPSLKERFQRASTNLSAGYTQEELEEYDRVVNAINDLEALELVARHAKKFPLLVVKVHLMIYLAETMPEYRSFYINRNDTPYKGWIFLFLSSMRTALKFLKGFLLLAKLKI